MLTQTPQEAFAAYQQWLALQPLAANTRRTYRVQVGQYCAYLATRSPEQGDPLRDPFASSYAVRDYRLARKTQDKIKPTSINLSLAAIDHFYRFLGLDRPEVSREVLPQVAPHGLEPAEQVAFLRAVERSPVLRDRAIAHLLFYTGIRLGECAALDVEDVPLSARRGKVIVRSGKGDAYREIPLGRDVRRTLDVYLKERRTCAVAATPSLFLNPTGGRLSIRAIDLVIRRLGREAGLPLSAHRLRHTCLTVLVRAGVDLGPAQRTGDDFGYGRFGTLMPVCYTRAHRQVFLSRLPRHLDGSHVHLRALRASGPALHRSGAA